MSKTFKMNAQYLENTINKTYRPYYQETCFKNLLKSVVKIQRFLPKVVITFPLKILGLSMSISKIIIVTKNSQMKLFCHESIYIKKSHLAQSTGTGRFKKYVQISPTKTNQD